MYNIFLIPQFPPKVSFQNKAVSLKFFEDFWADCAHRIRVLLKDTECDGALLELKNIVGKSEVKQAYFPIVKKRPV